MSALDMPNMRIRSTRLAREQEIIVEIESTLTMAACRQCGCSIDEVVGYGDPHRLPDLSSATGVTRIYFYPKRFRCPHCADHPTTVEQFRWPAAEGTNEKMVGG